MLNSPFFQMGYVTEFIKHISKRSQIVAHQLIWNMQTNMFMDEDQQQKDRKCQFGELLLAADKQRMTNKRSIHFQPFCSICWRR